MSHYCAFFATDYVANKPIWEPTRVFLATSPGSWLNGPYLHFHTAGVLCETKKCHYLPRKQGLKMAITLQVSRRP
jgi:hypothetical protein